VTGSLSHATSKPDACSVLADAAAASALRHRCHGHPNTHQPTRHTCYVAWAGSGAFLLAGRLASPEELLGLDLDALARGDQQGARAKPDTTAGGPRRKHPV